MSCGGMTRFEKRMQCYVCLPVPSLRCSLFEDVLAAQQQIRSAPKLKSARSITTHFRRMRGLPTRRLSGPLVVRLHYLHCAPLVFLLSYMLFVRISRWVC
jgi:hypothetical protein